MGDQCNAIGEAAGKIYRVLEQNGARTVTQLQKEVSVSDPALFNQALGWLAREGKLNFQKEGKAWKLALFSGAGTCCSA